MVTQGREGSQKWCVIYSVTTVGNWNLVPLVKSKRPRSTHTRIIPPRGEGVGACTHEIPSILGGGLLLQSINSPAHWLAVHTGQTYFHSLKKNLGPRLRIFSVAVRSI